MFSERRLVVLLLLATFAVYLPTLANGFVFDDRMIAVGVRDGGLPNPRIAVLQPLAVYFSTHYWADSAAADLLFRPVTILSFALSHAAWGDLAWPAHLGNVWLHVWATWLVWRLCQRLELGSWAALGGAACFGLHAVHVEVVATVVGRAELLSFCFGALAVLLAFPAEPRRPVPAALATGAAMLGLFAAFASKESGLGWVVVLAAFGAARRWQRGGRLDRAGLGRLAGRVAACALPPLVAFLWLRQTMIASLPEAPEPVLFAVNPLADAPVAVRVATATRVLAHGLWLCLAPFDLAADWGARVFEVGGLDRPGSWLAAGVLLGLVVAGLWQRRSQPVAALALASFLGFALITANLLFPIGTIFAERLLYQPSLGTALATAWGLVMAMRRGLGVPASAALGAWLVACAWVIASRGPLYGDETRLVANDVVRQPDSAWLHAAAGEQALGHDDLREAEAHFAQCRQLLPEDASTWLNTGVLRLRQHDAAAAEAAWRRGLALTPIHVRQELALRRELFGLLLANGRRAAALQEIERSLRREPSALEAWTLGLRATERGALTAAELVEVLEALERARPGQPQWQCYRAFLAAQARDFPRAIAHLRPALGLLPRRPRDATLRALARLVLGSALLETGDRDGGQSVLRDLLADPATPHGMRDSAAPLVR